MTVTLAGQLSGTMLGGNTTGKLNVTVLHPPLDLLRAVPVGILLAAIIFIVVFGNILVIIAVMTTRSLRTVTCNYYIVSLAVSDLLLGVLVLPFSSAKEIMNYWTFSSFVCVAWLTTDVISSTASILNLLCISVDRYLAISRPLHYHKYSSPRFVFIMIGAAWILAFLISVAPVFGFDSSGDQADQCNVAASGLFWTLYSSVGSFFLPLLVMLFLYYRIYLVAAKHSQFMKEERERYASFAQQQQDFDNNVHNRNLSLDQGSGEPNHAIGNHRISRVTIVSNGTPITEYDHFPPKDSLVQIVQHGKKSGLMKKLRRLSKDKKAAKTLFIVMACFILCWFPFFTIYLIDGVCKEVCSVPQWLFKVFFWLGYCNSMLNPVIYTTTSHDFRTAFRRILHCHVPNDHQQQTFVGDTADYRTITSSSNTTIGNTTRPTTTTGNGRLSAASPNTNNRRQKSSTLASRLINKTRVVPPPFTQDSPVLNRFPAVGQNYALVVPICQQDKQQENGLSHTNKPASDAHVPAAAATQSREIANAPLQSHCDLSLEWTSGPDDGSIKVTSKRIDDSVSSARCCGPGTSTEAETLLSHCPDDKSMGGSPLVTGVQRNGSVFPMSGWGRVKVKARKMVSSISFTDTRKNRHGEKCLPTTGHDNLPISKPPTEMTDAIVTTADMDISEKFVQTSISFVDLGNI